jgi:hypothetical protein
VPSDLDMTGRRPPSLLNMALDCAIHSFIGTIVLTVCCLGRLLIRRKPPVAGVIFASSLFGLVACAESPPRRPPAEHVSGRLPSLFPLRVSLRALACCARTPFLLGIDDDCRQLESWSKRGYFTSS